MRLQFHVGLNVESAVIFVGF